MPLCGVAPLQSMVTAARGTVPVTAAADCALVHPIARTGPMVIDRLLPIGGISAGMYGLALNPGRKGLRIQIDSLSCVWSLSPRGLVSLPHLLLPDEETLARERTPGLLRSPSLPLFAVAASQNAHWEGVGLLAGHNKGLSVFRTLTSGGAPPERVAFAYRSATGGPGLAFRGIHP